ncbi:MAG: dihydropteroate synthase [Immundisolibacteraceae bacterium]|nr:dihydropteroate synthase [Immundisolibacteraceae bacterium]
MIIDCGGRPLNLGSPVVMGVLNVTPDSFSDGGDHFDTSLAIERGITMISDGAAIVDIGGESTRPGAEPVSIQQELDRVLPVLEVLVAEVDVPISVDTRHAEVMAAVIDAGAGMINDVNALRDPGAVAAVSQSSVAVCLMHMHANPETMQDNPQYSDPVQEIYDFLAVRVSAAEAAGIDRRRLILDPGFGFGKTLNHNLQLLANLERFSTLGFPLLVGLSRKSMIGEILGVPASERLYGSVAAAVLAVERGAQIIRCHDVAETCQALKVVAAI